jgi:hypothetical protein
MNDYQHHGELASKTKEVGSSRLARLATLQLNHEGGDLDFNRKAYDAGKRALRRYLTDDLFQRHSPAEVDAALDLYIGGTLEIVGAAVRDERSIRAAWAN